MTDHSLKTPIAPKQAVIGILCALPEEAVAIRDSIVKGEINGEPLVLALSGMGKVNAAMAAQKMISENKIKVMIFTGVAGGIHPDLEIGDMMMAEEVFQHDYGFWGKEFKAHAVGRLPEIGIGTSYKPLKVSLRENFDSMDRLYEKLNVVAQEFAPIEIDGNSRVPLLKKGVIATGDQFIASESKKAELLGLGADAVEMEGAAVAQVCIENQIPLLLIRAISDKAGIESHFDFKSFVASASINNAKLVKAAVLHFLF